MKTLLPLLFASLAILALNSVPPRHVPRGIRLCAVTQLPCQPNEIYHYQQRLLPSDESMTEVVAYKTGYLKEIEYKSDDIAVSQIAWYFPDGRIEITRYPGNLCVTTWYDQQGFRSMGYWRVDDHQGKFRSLAVVYKSDGKTIKRKTRVTCHELVDLFPVHLDNGTEVFNEYHYSPWYSHTCTVEHISAECTRTIFYESGGQTICEEKWDYSSGRHITIKWDKPIPFDIAQGANGISDVLDPGEKASAECRQNTAEPGSDVQESNVSIVPNNYSAPESTGFTGCQ